MKVETLETLACDAGWRNYHFVKLTTDTGIVGWSEYDEGFGLVKINPLAAWSDEQMQDYIDAHGILVNPLVDEGYPSIGCAPCTAKPAPGADPRSGRWAGQAKTECGLHVS